MSYGSFIVTKNNMVDILDRRVFHAKQTYKTAKEEGDLSASLMFVAFGRE